ncbi:MAG: pyridoxal 5'-phosphate synthase glutaminase subunit PdxT [Candidatus Nitrosocaldaceae archaeon]|nr:MAG: pyridoxal 5'-phosphate synthase glutaminase subunit PdxT [Candidatus Nitrosocaldaceae archaeon]
MKIGVLALQGDIEENINASKKALDNLNKDGIVLPVKYPNQIKEVDALIIPGGESTVIGLLAMLSNSTDIIIDRIKDGMPVLGTCAGMILLAKRAYDRVVGETKQPLLSLLDIVVERNAFGRQIDSFEAEISIDGIADRFNGVFIRAPIVAEYANNVKPIAKLGNKVVAVQQDNIIGTAFHPELSNNTSVHEHLINMI